MNLCVRLTGFFLKVCGLNDFNHANFSRSRWVQTARFANSFPLVIAVALQVGIGATIGQAADSEFPDEWYFDQMESMREKLEGNLAIELSTDTWIGDATTLEDSRGKVVVLDFWATWCGPCVAAIPKNIAMVDAYPDDLVFIGVHSATSGWDKAPDMVEDREINYPVVLDTGETGDAYGINAFPTYIIIDRTGVVRAAGVQPGHVKSVVDKLIEESAPEERSFQFVAFDSVWFYSGADRMRSWQDQLGQPATPIQAQAWWLPGDGAGTSSQDGNTQDSVVQDHAPTEPASADSDAKQDVQQEPVDDDVGAESVSEAETKTTAEKGTDDESNDAGSQDTSAEEASSTDVDSAQQDASGQAVAEDSAAIAAQGDEPDGASHESIAEAPDGLRWDELEGVVRVLHFTRPGMRIAQKQLKALNETAAKYAPQGVAFIVVCDHESDWQATQVFASEAELNMAIAWDASATKESLSEEIASAKSAADASVAPPREAGRTAASYHVRIAPVTIVIDRKGRIRATGLKLEQLSDALNMLLSEQAG